MIPIPHYNLRKRQLAWLAAAGVFVWFYWSSLGHLWQTWATDEDYWHGFFVPIFALALLWIRRRMAPPSPMRTSLWGPPFLAVWAVTCWVSVRFNYGTLFELSMLPFLAGAVLTVCG